MCKLLCQQWKHNYFSFRSRAFNDHRRTVAGTTTACLTAWKTWKFTFCVYLPNLHRSICLYWYLCIRASGCLSIDLIRFVHLPIHRFISIIHRSTTILLSSRYSPLSSLTFPLSPLSRLLLLWISCSCCFCVVSLRELLYYLRIWNPKNIYLP